MPTALIRLPSIHLLIVFTLFFQAACSRAQDKEEMRKVELGYLRTIMPEELLPHASLEVVSKEHVTIEGTGEKQHLALHLFEKNAHRGGGVRSEVSLDYPFKEGDTVRYEWRFQLADDFPSDAPANRWWVIGQWHDQPDSTKGETWDGFPSRSPPVLIGFGEKEGRIGLVVNYGPSHAQKSEPLWLERGRWHRIAFLIRWSQKESGRADFFLDDMIKAAAAFTGPNMHNGFQHFLKIGMYRHPEIATRNTIHVDDVQVRHEK